MCIDLYRAMSLDTITDKLIPVDVTNNDVRNAQTTH
jgi:hypothetical protein